MNRYMSFQELLSTQSINLPIVSFCINMLLAALLASGLGVVYNRYGSSLSNRRTFASNFVLLTMTTVLVISVVKSSLALSLGLVGALSIVRFRAAIKEPEELTYLFLCVGIGLGFGANQRTITCVAFALAVAVIALRKQNREVRLNENFYLTIAGKKDAQTLTKDIVRVMADYCSQVDLKRLEESADAIELSFVIAIRNADQIDECKSRLLDLCGKETRISLLDHTGIMH